MTLSPRHREVLRTLVRTRGGSNKQIARELGVSPRTVTNHLHEIYRRLEVPNRTAAMNWYRDNHGSSS